MKAKLDKFTCGKKTITGLTTKLEGRIRGSLRSRKFVSVWGKQGQQDRLRRIQYHSTAINTRYGTLGIKVQIAMKHTNYSKLTRKPLSNNTSLVLNHRLIELLEAKRLK